MWSHTWSSSLHTVYIIKYDGMMSSFIFSKLSTMQMHSIYNYVVEPLHKVFNIQEYLAMESAFLMCTCVMNREVSKRKQKVLVHIHNGMLLSYKKECIWVSSFSMRWMKLEPIIQSEVRKRKMNTVY